MQDTIIGAWAANLGNARPPQSVSRNKIWKVSRGAVMSSIPKAKGRATIRKLVRDAMDLSPACLTESALNN